MGWKVGLSRAVGFLRGDGARDRELRDEIRSHIELETQENVERGMDPAEARRSALLRFGNPQLVYESSRGMWGIPSLESVLFDLRYGWRILKKNPLFSAVAVLTLAVGLGSSIAVFT